MRRELAAACSPAGHALLKYQRRDQDFGFRIRFQQPLGRGAAQHDVGVLADHRKQRRLARLSVFLSERRLLFGRENGRPASPDGISKGMAHLIAKTRKSENTKQIDEIRLRKTAASLQSLGSSID
ncbi:MAG TPA: hypothetical protein VMV10_15835 [Pirellulales bacterium]|nr:hypothetical protein [Pirellulales bacterium]